MRLWCGGRQRDYGLLRTIEDYGLARNQDLVDLSDSVEACCHDAELSVVCPKVQMLWFDNTDDIYEFLELDMEEEIASVSAKRCVAEIHGESGDDMYDAEYGASPVMGGFKRPKSSSLGFSAKSILPHLQEVYSSDSLLSAAARTLVKYMYLQMSDSKKRFVYALDAPWTASPIILTLTALKGSLRTVLWSRVARYDDEYVLEVSGVDEYESMEERIDSPAIDLLWTMKGLDSDDLCVGPSVVNWTVLRTLQSRLQLHNIGVHAFAKLLSRIVLNLPNFEREGRIFEPMPATIMVSSMLKTQLPCEVVGFSDQEMYADSFVKGLIADLTESDGGGVWLPNFLPEKTLRSTCSRSPSDMGVQPEEEYWDSCSMRVVEIRRCPSAGDDIAVEDEGGRAGAVSSAPPALPPIVVVLGMCCNKGSHKRFVCIRPDLVRKFVRNGSSEEFDILTEEEWSTHYGPATPSAQSRNTSTDICFSNSSNWGSAVYHRAAVVGLQSSAAPEWGVGGDEKWQKGEVLYFSALLWFKEEELAKLCTADGRHNARDVFVEGHVVRRSPKLVTLSFPSMGAEYKRGFTFMSKWAREGPKKNWWCLLTAEDIKILESKN